VTETEPRTGKGIEAPAGTTRGYSAIGPDFPFDYESWLAHPAGLGTVPHDAHGEPVAIIGAGVAGVVAAYELARMGLRPVLYEAGRIGGRLRSEPFGGADGVFAELGGMRFPRSGRAFFHYAELVDTETRPFPNPLTPAAPTTVVDLEGVTSFARTLDDLPVIFTEVAQAWDAALHEHADLAAMQRAMSDRDPDAIAALWHELVPVWDDRTFYDFVATSDAFSRLSFHHREIFGQVGFGTGGWDSDFPNTMLEILRVVMNRFEDDQQMIVGGAEHIVRRLWQAPLAAGVNWPDGASVASIGGGATRPAVASISRSGSDSLRIVDVHGVEAEYGAVLSTVQSWLLTTRIDVEERLFGQKLWMALDRTRYMQSSKTFVMVDRPFWNDIDPATGRPPLSMTLTDRNTRGTYLFDNGPDRPAVVALSYAWMGDAMKVLPLTAQERANLALDTLAKIYPNTDIRSHVMGDPITVSWEADPNFQGAFKGALPGHYRYNRRMYSHFVQRDLPPYERGLFLAGDEVSWTPGWAEGAVQTGLNAVWGIMTHFGGSCSDANPGPGDRWDDLAPLRLPE